MSALEKRPDPEQQLLEDIAGFFDDPLGFVMYAYPWGEPGPLEKEEGPDTWQVDFLTDLGEQIRRGMNPSEALQTAIRFAYASGHGIGKSAAIAWVIQWFMATREFPQVVVTASTQTQLTTKTWRELAKWHRLLICQHWFQWQATKYFHVAYPDTWFASAIPWSDHNADAFAGTHEKYVLIIYDEGQAVGDKIYETTEGALTTPGAIWIVFGNYTKNSGRFHECFTGVARDRWIKRQIDSRTCKKANKAQIEEWIKDYGEDSDFVRIRVRGIAPRAGSNQFIGQDLVDAAQKYKAEGYEALPKILSLDVARFGDNKSVAGTRQGRKVRVLKKWMGLAIDQLADRFCELIDEEDPDAIVVDGDGIGGAVCDLIRRKKYHLKGGQDILTEFHGNAEPADPTLYFNRRTEIWGDMRQAMKDGCEHPVDPELASDLVGPEYTYQKKGQYEVILLESKKDMRARGVASPDTGDMVAMTYAVKLKAEPRVKKSQGFRRAGSGGGNAGWMGN